MGYAGAQRSLPLEWVDSLTHHRVIRLTRTGVDNKSFYFHNNPFVKTPDGKTDLMIYAGVVNGDLPALKKNLFL
jgi:oligogalacturonide lyase